ncbi:SDR family NAD(P)-dependent oxidoreductase [Helicobacter anatolicus]|uniref:SDR family NAD(P)-dependent oxidoreductase n=1 Tax=Helicobacter anatolicus TaxID=2905874 RepID=UPI001E51E374|nr:SDR family NAD(P)-dependent oxidoreductase [Helicobacter anatolicus]MCE3039193.1 SDR family NAD(P)-dependent oxidoreductase [Helicobacter anatolicus]
MLAFITGASSGIGEAIARKFVEQNHQVILLARRKEKLLTLQKELGKQCLAILPCDINNTKEISAMLEVHGKDIDILINNAGLALGISNAQESSLKDWETMIETNILGLVKLTHLILPFMIEKNLGHIINIGSIAGTYPYPGSNIYGATKAFVKQFSLNLRADLIGKNIRVSNIEPGLTGGSEFSLVRFYGDKKRAENLYKNSQPLMAQDVAESVYWCASLPKHININRIEMMPTTQAPAGLKVYENNN